MHINQTEDNRVSETHARAVRGAHLNLRGLTKRYGSRTVLDAVNLKIEPGEFVAVVGRSGCGKSTLLRAIAGLERPDAGSVNIGGAGAGAGGGAPEVRMMFQDARLLPWKTVLQNVALSGGQRQRVALARALVHEPQLLLLDEPLGALDALTRIEMQGLIESLWTARGFTAVLVTHDVQEAVVLADRILLVEQGRLALDLDVSLARPRARGEAAFAALEGKVLARVLDTRQTS